MGRRIWVVIPGDTRYKETSYSCRVLSFLRMLPAGEVEKDHIRKKHLVQLWTDPGGIRTLSVGSIRLKDPGKVAAGYAAADAREEANA